MDAVVSAAKLRTLAVNDEQEHRPRQLLSMKATVCGASLDAPVAAGLDEYEQRPARDAGRDARCSFW
jgi:hypothetical protein